MRILFFAGLVLSGPVLAQEQPEHFGRVIGNQQQVMPRTKGTPRVFLQAASKGTNWNAARDQAMEMSKDFERDCPGARVTINQQAADYVVLLNHIEVGLLARDNQVQVANRDGDLISRTKEGGSIAAGMKKACALIVADWAALPSGAQPQPESTPQPPIASQALDAPQLPIAPPAPAVPQSAPRPQVAARPKVAPQHPEGIVVRFTSTPTDSEVQIDGEYWGGTPTADLTRLPAGSHTILIKKLGFQPWERKISLALGDDRTINAELEPQTQDPNKPRISGQQ
jgi:hypothetical protein